MFCGTERAIFLEAPAEPGQGSLFAQTATLTEAVSDTLKKHPIPLEESAIRAISNNSLALDTYAWLAYRLHVLVDATPVLWPAVSSSSGRGSDASTISARASSRTSSSL